MPNSIVAVGGNLNAKSLLSAYSKGIFPWPHQGLPLLWFCPDPRTVLFLDQIKISRSLKKELKKTSLLVKADTNFMAVISACKDQRRPDQDSTWITDEMRKAYYELHKQGFAHSIEAYDNNKLVGGLYGVSLGKMFFGESMFYLQKNAAKVCLVTLAAQLHKWHFTLIDCQSHTNNMARFGAIPISRQDFLHLVKKNTNHDSIKAPWQITVKPCEAELCLWPK